MEAPAGMPDTAVELGFALRQQTDSFSIIDQSPPGDVQPRFDMITPVTRNIRREERNTGKIFFMVRGSQKTGRHLKTTVGVNTHLSTKVMTSRHGRSDSWNPGIYAEKSREANAGHLPGLNVTTTGALTDRTARHDVYTPVRSTIQIRRVVTGASHSAVDEHGTAHLTGCFPKPNPTLRPHSMAGEMFVVTQSS
ncbi:hypothetical protein BaRGS_00021128, partial [Batillaria attramentaria]